MNIVLTGIAAAIVLGLVAAFVMRADQTRAWEAYSTSSARVGDPGYNLVGKNWTGEPQVQRKNS
jgi:hypothetical protein